jgi:hypothetical protein
MLSYILNNQGNLRTEHFQGITNAISRDAQGVMKQKRPLYYPHHTLEGGDT